MKTTKEIAASVREQLKKELPGWKFSVRFESFSGGSSINLSLMSGPEQVMVGSGYAQLNQYTFKDSPTAYGRDYHNNGVQLTPKGWEVMRAAVAILSADHWDKSDIQTDYFCTNFYMHVEIGRWDRDYQVVVK